MSTFFYLFFSLVLCLVSFYFLSLFHHCIALFWFTFATIHANLAKLYALLVQAYHSLYAVVIWKREFFFRCKRNKNICSLVGPEFEMLCIWESTVQINVKGNNSLPSFTRSKKRARAHFSARFCGSDCHMCMHCCW